MTDEQQQLVSRPLTQVEVVTLERELRKMLPRWDDPTHPDWAHAAQFRAAMGLPPRRSLAW